MKKVITYGTYDLLHHGHINLLKRAKELGDYLIVGVTTENYDKGRGKLNVHRSTLERIEDVRKTGFADEIIIEEYEGQKIDDIQKYGVDIFAIGSDWKGKFDYLSEYCDVVYLERTKGISSTQLRGETKKIQSIGIIGGGQIADSFIVESKYVSGVNVNGIYHPDLDVADKFANYHEISFFTNDLETFFSKIDAVYIVNSNLNHADYISKALKSGKHVLCESPIVSSANELRRLYKMASEQKLILMEAIKTAYSPAFHQLISIVKSGAIGAIKDIDVSFTKLLGRESKEQNEITESRSILELVTYNLLPIIKLLGTDYKDLHFYTHMYNNVDLFTRGILYYEKSVASIKVGLGVKTEDDLVISGTKGYAYVPSPWWRTESFELRYEDQNKNRKYFSKFEGDGQRYEIHEFLSLINNTQQNLSKVTPEDSIGITDVIEKFIQGKNRHLIK